MTYLISLFFLLSNLCATDQPKLTLHIQNIESGKGKIIIGVFNTDKDFLKDGVAVKNYTVDVNSANETFVITDLPKGVYAISLYHDENSDNKFNRNFLGIPKEGYGFSNNVKPRFSAPSFEDCKFSLTTDLEMKIKVIN
ncbi:uncharacterized protein (DUF2141 family) [Gelidibacter algens]|uniref:Uncharacterized protein (DUF2141 family) n=1 Tax=Gelidibacter algens TaxID=49280 RepID=A0A1A7QZF9_9FLAO|nr:DUF2141 domain-containing protein [Gelidibacter algens]OBX24951.1 hypothetical protein A9996_12700 [Gelidibacter algens]RAJ24785.1 uncharacterized protein (DUF2141 family) [Gelidibacter algens]